MEPCIWCPLPVTDTITYPKEIDVVVGVDEDREDRYESKTIYVSMKFCSNHYGAVKACQLYHGLDPFPNDMVFREVYNWIKQICFFCGSQDLSVNAIDLPLNSKLHYCDSCGKNLLPMILSNTNPDNGAIFALYSKLTVSRLLGFNHGR